MTEEILYHNLHKTALSNHFLENDWIWVYKTARTVVNNEDIYFEYFAYLATPTCAAKSLCSADNDIDISSPIAIMGDYTYHSHAVDGFEHLVVVRDFNIGITHIRDIRIAEEIVYYHHLFERKDDQGNIQYFSIENGSEILVCEISSCSVRILHRYLAEFMAAKKMDLVCTCTSEVEFSLDKVQLPFKIQLTPNCAYTDISPNINTKFIQCVACDKGPLQSWFKGKTIYKHTSLKLFLERMTPDIYYIVGTNESGCIDFSNENTSPYTPIFFKKEVLDHYSNRHGGYTIEPLRITTPKFLLRCDNDNSDYVIVFLKDLRDDLPYEDQCLWRSYNIPPDGRSFSSLFQNTIIEGNWNSESQSIDFIFKDTYKTLLKKWENRYSWNLLKDLHGVQSEVPSHIYVLTRNDYPSLKQLVENLALTFQECFNFSAFAKISPREKYIRDVVFNTESVKKISEEPPIDYFNRICGRLNRDIQ